jgi:hypothetical protein
MRVELHAVRLCAGDYGIMRRYVPRNCAACSAA